MTTDNAALFCAIVLSPLPLAGLEIVRPLLYLHKKTDNYLSGGFFGLALA